MADVTKERRCVRLLYKQRGTVPARKQYKLRYFWYNPHDPFFLRYAKDSDMRFVKVIPVKDSAMVAKADRDTPSANTMVLNCLKRFKIKFTHSGTSWTLYFQSQREYDDWLDLFTQIRGIEQDSLNEMAEKRRQGLQENWYEGRYGQSGGDHPRDSNGSSGERRKRSASGAGMTTTSPPPGRCNSPVLSRRVPLMLIVELPEALGFIRLSLDRLDTQVVTIKRFKERLFESAHLNMHASYHLANGHDKNEARNGSRYSRRSCETCGGTLRPMISRQMFRQEESLNWGPDHFVLQVGSVFTVKDYLPVDPDSIHVSNPRFTNGGGLYEPFHESSEDELLLKSFEFVSAALGTKPLPKEDALDWVEDETLALSALIERAAPNRPLVSKDSAATTTVIHLVLRPSRDLPLKRFFVSVTRYTREFDAMTSFSVYVASVRHGDLKWEIRRRFSEFKELDTALRELASKDPLKRWKLPGKVPPEAKRTVFRRNAENDELRLIRDLNVYLRQMVSDNEWDPPPVELLSFLGIVNTGKNSLMNNSVTRKRRVCHLDALSELAEPGDIVLFRSVNPIAGLQRVVTGRCTFDHIGLVVKRKRAGYELLEATGEGVTAYPLEDRLEAYSLGFCDLIALRKLRFERTEDVSALLAEFANQVEGKPYRLTIGKLASSRIKSNSTSDSRKRAYFCSELVAEALRYLGVMSTTGRPDSFFLPHFFDEGGLAEKYLVGGCALDDVIFVDCHNPEVKYSQPTPNKV